MSRAGLIVHLCFLLVSLALLAFDIHWRLAAAGVIAVFSALLNAGFAAYWFRHSRRWPGG